MSNPILLTADLLRPQCQGRWLEIFRAICPGMFDEAIANIGNHVTCPFHGGEEDFRFTKKPSKKGGSTAQCGVAMCTCGFYTDGFAVLHKAMGGRFYDVLKAINEYLNGATPVAVTYTAPERIKPVDRSDDEILAKVNALWEAAKPIDLSTTPYYLERGMHPRAIERLQDVRVLATLGYYVREKGEIVKKGSFPAILAAMRDANGKLVAVHRTWLSKDRKDKAPVSKAKKLSETPGVVGAAIRLFNAKGSDVLGLTEGIETALSAKQLAKGRYWPELGDIPVWACFAERNIRSFQIPDELRPTLRKIVVFADNDENGKGLEAATEFKERMEKEHPEIEVEIKLPHIVGWDWNDVLVNL